MTDTNSAPVSIAAGSYDYDALKKATDKAANGTEKNYDGAIAGIADLRDKAFEPVDPSNTPGYVRKDFEGPTGVVESRQVYDPKLEEDAKAAASTATVIPPTTPSAPADKPATSQE